MLLLQEIENNKKQAETEKKAYDDLLRERDILSKVMGSYSYQLELYLNFVPVFAQSRGLY